LPVALINATIDPELDSTTGFLAYLVPLTFIAGTILELLLLLEGVIGRIVVGGDGVKVEFSQLLANLLYDLLSLGDLWINFRGLSIHPLGLEAILAFDGLPGYKSPKMCLHFGSGINTRRIVGNRTAGRIWLDLLWLKMCGGNPLTRGILLYRCRLVHYLLCSVIEGLLIFIAGSLATLSTHFYSEKLH
jgi:hypothetical protein